MPAVATPQTRKAIRQGVRQLLLGRTRAGDRVFANRSEAVQHNRAGGELPALLVRCATEPVELANEAPQVYRRSVRLVVEVIVQREQFPVGGGTMTQALAESETESLDAICDEVEGLLLADPTLEETTGLRAADDVNYVDTRFDFDARAEQVIGSALVEFDYIYQTQIDEQEVLAAVDANHVHVDYFAPFPQPMVSAQDDLDLPVT